MSKNVQTAVKGDVNAIAAALIKALGIRTDGLANSKSGVSAKQDRVLKRNAAVARGFARKGLKLAFDKATGQFENVKPYKLWLAEGRVVRKGEHGVRGLFHVSQTDLLPVISKEQMRAETVQVSA